ncbi:MAG: hypothetical protein EOP87_07315 [Verrucomicrobiaceae bacterium]|nr:MAG: hypothetical protein EOP87_07315 [Verrucomicrobiaceae bacterium]
MIDLPTESCSPCVAEQFDNPLIFLIEKYNRFAASTDQREWADRIRIVEVGQAQRQRPSEIRRFAKDGAQFVFDLAAREPTAEAALIKASSGSTGPVRDSSVAERRRLRRVCSNASSAEIQG